MDAERFSVKQPIDLTRPMTQQASSTLSTVTVTASEVSKTFQVKGQMIHAVDKVSLTCTEGQFVTILGPSGSGKSTLLYLLGGLDRLSAGELIVDGVNITRLPTSQEYRFRRHKLGFVFQSFHLIANLTALENVLLPMELAGDLSRTEMYKRASLLLTQVGIDEKRYQHTPGKLSGGQQQRVAIARALANDPRVLLADEPTGNLDSQTGKLIVELLKQLAEQGKTVIVVTHDPGIAEVADVHLRMQDGKLFHLNG